VTLCEGRELRAHLPHLHPRPGFLPPLRHGLKPLVSHNAELIGPAGPGTEARVGQPQQRPGQALVAAAVRWMKAWMPRQWSRPAI